MVAQANSMCLGQIAAVRCRRRLYPIPSYMAICSLPSWATRFSASRILAANRSSAMVHGRYHSG